MGGRGLRKPFLFSKCIYVALYYMQLNGPVTSERYQHGSARVVKLTSVACDTQLAKWTVFLNRSRVNACQ